jgi:hypothetical protein
LTGGKLITVLLQCISGVNAINRLVAFYDINGGKREVLFFYLVPDTTRDHTYNESSAEKPSLIQTWVTGEYTHYSMMLFLFIIKIEHRYPISNIES